MVAYTQTYSTVTPRRYSCNSTACSSLPCACNGWRGPTASDIVGVIYVEDPTFDPPLPKIKEKPFWIREKEKQIRARPDVRRRRE